MFCTSHPQQPISLVCVAEHKCKCQRKMCVECLNEHGVEIKQAVPINKFHETLLKKLKENQLEDTSELINKKIGFKQLLSETEAIMKKLWEDLASSIKLIYEMIEQENNSYINLIINNDNLAESSFIDLEKLVQIQNGRILDDWNYKKNSYVLELDKAKQWLEIEVKNFNQKFKQQINEILQMFRIETKKQWIWKEGTQQLRGFFWNYTFSKLLKQTTTLQINFTLDKEIQYFRDGSMLRMQEFIKINLEIKKQTLHRSQKFQLIQNKSKIYNGLDNMEIIISKQANGSQYGGVKKYRMLVESTRMIEKNKVFGQIWQKIIRNKHKCLKKASIRVAKELVFGSYFSNITRYIYYIIKQLRGGGVYENGKKNKKWQELSESFDKNCQVTYKGQYKNGKKVGRWDIQYRPDVDKPFSTIGGGQYDEAGDGIKFGNWVEISDNYYDDSQVIYKGQYNNGKKVGIWDIQYRYDVDKPFITIGGGQYDEAGDQLKLGNWVDISDNFNYDSQVTYKGQYQNGKKVGSWFKMTKEYFNNQITQEKILYDY